MRRLLQMLRSEVVGDDPVALLYHYLRGQMVNWVDGNDGPVHWATASHRGVQWLNKVRFPRKQKRYIFSPLFEIRYDRAFEEVVCGCADLSREGRTWICEPLIRGLVKLHHMGFAHSYEAWHNNQLVGGAFGVQFGSLITCDSMFHRMDNASKAAYGQTLVHLQQRGFKVVDTNGVAKHRVNYGEEWMPSWQFEQLLLNSLKDSPSIIDARPCPPLPWEIRAMIPALRVGRRVVRSLRNRHHVATVPLEPAADVEPPHSPSPPGEAADKAKRQAG